MLFIFFRIPREVLLHMFGLYSHRGLSRVLSLTSQTFLFGPNVFRFYKKNCTVIKENLNILNEIFHFSFIQMSNMKLHFSSSEKYFSMKLFGVLLKKRLRFRDRDLC
ncbi:hypothetical protein ATANTOWER_001529 [Ataeniobius toweri]|uniref:Uncharacterized protein n=1 Tax=Ataeniobius toweri TaxID=208326 RepID=A0ABU7ACL1_9TELE|nr:hypothetical protein [Ataeniobius toweri]